MVHELRSFSGFAPSIPTPFDNDFLVDFTALGELCDRQICAGATALIVCGTTGEASTLTPEEQEAVIEVAVTVSGGRVPVIAGAGSNSTAHAIELGKAAEAAGADAILSVVPYYNKPGQAGIEAHFRAIVQSSGLSVILHDAPSRTGLALGDETLARLAELPRIAGLKDAGADIARPLRLRRLLDPDFLLLSGEDATALPFIMAGGHGCISVTANVAPGLCRKVYEAWCRGDVAGAQQTAAALARLTAALSREPDPAPVKYALSLAGLILPRVRLPLVELSAAGRLCIEAALAELSETHPQAALSDALPDSGQVDSTAAPARS